MCSNMNKLNNILYRIWHDIRGMLLLFLIIGFMTGCIAPKKSLSNIPQAKPDASASSQPGEQSGPSSIPASSRPSVSWQPSFTVEDVQVKESKSGLPELKVGANIESQSGKVVLRDIISGLAKLKEFNVSWNKDANPNAMVDVDIKADDDFWIASFVNWIISLSSKTTRSSLAINRQRPTRYPCRMSVTHLLHPWVAICSAGLPTPIILER